MVEERWRLEMHVVWSGQIKDWTVGGKWDGAEKVFCHECSQSGTLIEILVVLVGLFFCYFF